ncbi:hypothetical protein ACJX0J_038540 [Zea mays]
MCYIPMLRTYYMCYMNVVESGVHVIGNGNLCYTENTHHWHVNSDYEFCDVDMLSKMHLTCRITELYAIFIIGRWLKSLLAPKVTKFDCVQNIILQYQNMSHEIQSMILLGRYTLHNM